jgi:radical SAM superfamily enzyme YgiQ (UPF0313 family)
MKVLFVNPFYPFDPFTVLLHPPLAYGYLANQLKFNHDVIFADIPFEGNSVESLKPYLIYRPDVIGITCVAKSYKPALECAEYIKKNLPESKVVLGGPHVSFIPQEVLARHAQVDFVILFDGEFSFIELLEAIENGNQLNSLRKISGLAFKNDKKIFVIPPSHPERNPDIFGIPDRTIFNMKRYLAHDYETVILGARGCPSKCTFCSSTQAGRKFRTHSVKHLCDEIEQVLTLGFKSIFFGDDTFSGNKQRTFEFCAEIKRRNLIFPWTSNMRQIDACDTKLIEAMKEAGAYRVFMGFESINKTTLRDFKKGTNALKLYETAKLLKSIGIEIHSSFIIGAPGDNPYSIEATIDYIRLVNPTIATFNTMEARPGTDVYNNPGKYGIIIPDKYWYETLDWLYTGTCYTKDLSQDEIRYYVNKCYSEFCSYNFLNFNNMKIAHDRFKDVLNLSDSSMSTFF